MAYNTIYFEHQITHQARRAPVGYAWTVLFFGPLPFLARREWMWFAVMALLTVFTLHLSNVFLSFKINRYYINWLVAHGYRVARVKHGSAKRLARKLGMELPSLSSFLFNETKVAHR